MGMPRPNRCARKRRPCAIYSDACVAQPRGAPPGHLPPPLTVIAGAVAVLLVLSVPLLTTAYVRLLPFTAADRRDRVPRARRVEGSGCRGIRHGG